MARKQGTLELLPSVLWRCLDCGWMAPVALLQLVYLFGARHFTLREILHQDLLARDLSIADLTAAFSKEESVRALARINPRGFRNLTEDKWVFWEHARKHGLPVPQVLARLDRDGQMFPQQGRGAEDFARFVGALDLDGIVIKAVNGSEGEEVFVFSCENGILIDHKGGRHSPAKLYQEFLSTGFSFIIQERLRSHPDLVRLTGSEALHCLRLITCLDALGKAHLMIRKLRLGGPGNVVDNFGGGNNGAALCVLAEDGKIEKALVYDNKAKHIVMSDRLPANGKGLIGYQVPHWEAAAELVKRAAPHFDPLSCIGWDVALTDAGPFLIEGNVFWDPMTRLEAPMRPMWRRIEALTLKRDVLTAAPIEAT